jgi:hypothetical protein
LLKVLASDRTGLTAGAIAGVLERMFGYPDARVTRVRSDAQDRGLIHETTDERFSLTDAGETYLTTMISEFEYLQHVVMDAWVDGDHLMPAGTEETAGMRYERVLRFASWVRAIEVEEYGHVVRAGVEQLYDSYFGVDTLSGAICACLIGTDRMRYAIGNEVLASLQANTRELADRSDFASIRREALARQVPAE